MFQKPKKGGFSLIEVTLSLGLLAFALIPLIGLMPVGIRTWNDSKNQLAASSMLSVLSSSITSSSATENAFHASPPFNEIVSWSQSGSPSTSEIWLTEKGGLGKGPGDSLFKAQVKVVPASSSMFPTKAEIVVAWPVQAEIDFAETDGTPQGSLGYVRSTLYFYP